MHLEFLVEEESAEIALLNLIPKIIGTSVSFKIHAHQGKTDLLDKLGQRLRGYSKWVLEDWRIVVIIDEDRQDCRELKRKLEQAADRAGLATRTSTGHQKDFQVLNRIAIEELEAWFFGDPEAIVAAYPKTPKTIGAKAKYRDPDTIAGGTWEALERLLQRAGYYPGGLPKREAARNISAKMEPTRNKSRSFQVLMQALGEMVA
jgi:hypothetical protein